MTIGEKACCTFMVAFDYIGGADKQVSHVPVATSSCRFVANCQN